MPRLIHLTRASNARGIERGGIRGPTVFAMPVVAEFSIRHQWLRELRRWHRQRMIAVHFQVPSDETVLVGRYDAPHEQMSLGDAIRRVLEAPLGNELVVPRAVHRREIVAFHEVTQLVGWTETPDRPRWDCVCCMCLPAGLPDLMARVRAVYHRHLALAKLAANEQAMVKALGNLDIPLERAKGRISLRGAFSFARSKHADVRGAAASLLARGSWKEVSPVLRALLADDDSTVRIAAVEALMRIGDAHRVYEAVRHDDDLVCILLEQLAWSRNAERAAKLLLELHARGNDAVLPRIGFVARDLLTEKGIADHTRAKLQAIAIEA